MSHPHHQLWLRGGSFCSGQSSSFMWWHSHAHLMFSPRLLSATTCTLLLQSLKGYRSEILHSSGESPVGHPLKICDIKCGKKCLPMGILSHTAFPGKTMGCALSFINILKARVFLIKSVFGLLTSQWRIRQSGWMPPSSVSCMHNYCLMHSLGWGHWQTISLALDAARYFVFTLASLPSHGLVIEKRETCVHPSVTTGLRKCSASAFINNNAALNIMSFLHDCAKVFH